MYAGRKRRKPVQRSTKLVPVEGAKSNPSKRHRERLNAELERLAGLLPFQQDVISRLDKLSILRLSVSFLRAKSFFHALKSNSGDRIKDGPGPSDMVLPEGELLLQALNGFVLVVTSEGLVFYSSHTIQDYLGFHQSDVINQSVFELIHTEDRGEFQRQLHWAFNPPGTQHGATEDTHGLANYHPLTSAQRTCRTRESGTRARDTPSCSFLVTYNPEQLPPENSSFLERNFVARFRCLLDNSSGFMALHFQGRLKFLHGQNRKAADGAPVPSQLALFAVATPLQPPAILEIRTKNMIFRTKHKLDFTPLGCDAKGRVVLGYTEIELCMRGTGYQFIHAADMLHCAENHVRMMRTGESGLTVFRLLTKDKGWTWVQANARLVYKNGRPDYIIATQRPLSDEEGAEQLRKRSLHLPFTYATGEAVLYECNFLLPPSLDPIQSKGHGGGGRGKKASGSKGAAGGSGARGSLDPDSLLGAMLRQDESVYVCPPDPVPKFSFSKSYFSEMGGMSSLDPVDHLSRGRAVDRATITEDTSADMKPDISTALMLTNELDEFGQQGSSTMPGLGGGGDGGDIDDGAGGDLLSALQCFGISMDELDVFEQDERLVMLELDSLSAQLNETISNMDILDYVEDSLNRHTGQLSQGQLLTKPESSLSCPASTQSLGYVQRPQATNHQQLLQPQPPLHQPQHQQQKAAKQAQQQLFYKPKINIRYTSWDEQQQHTAMQHQPQKSHKPQRQQLQLMQHQAGGPVINGQIHQHTQQQHVMHPYQYTPLDEGGGQYKVEAATSASYTQSFPPCQQMPLNSGIAVDTSSYGCPGFSSSGASQSGEGQFRPAADRSSFRGYGRNATQLQQFVPSQIPAAQTFMLKQNFNLLSSCQYQSQQCPASVMKEQVSSEVSERQQQQQQQQQQLQQQQEEDLMLSCSVISCTVEQERQYKLPMDRNIGNGNVVYQGVNCEQLSSFPDGETLPVHAGMSQPMPDAMQYFLDS